MQGNGGITSFFDNAFARRLAGMVAEPEAPKESSGGQEQPQHEATNDSHTGSNGHTTHTLSGSLGERRGLVPVRSPSGPGREDNGSMTKATSKGLQRTGLGRSASAPRGGAASKSNDSALEELAAFRKEARKATSEQSPTASSAGEGSETWISVARSLSMLAENMRGWQEQMVHVEQRSEHVLNEHQSMFHHHVKHTEEVVKRELNLQFGDIRRMILELGFASRGPGSGFAAEDVSVRPKCDESTQTEHHLHLHGDAHMARGRTHHTAGGGLSSAPSSRTFHQQNASSIAGDGAKEFANAAHLESGAGVGPSPWSELRNAHKGDSSKSLPQESSRESSRESVRKGSLSPKGTKNKRTVSRDGKKDGMWTRRSTPSMEEQIEKQGASKGTAVSGTTSGTASKANQKLQEMDKRSTDSGSFTSEEWRSMLKEVEEQQLRDRMPQTGIIFQLCRDCGVPREWLPDPTKTTHRKLGLFVRGDCFNIISMVAICLNAVFVGIEADNSIKAALDGAPPSEAFININRFFVAFFTTELILKVIGLRKWFIFGQDGMWNILDAMIVASSIFWETQESGGGGSSSAARIARVLRLARVGRVLRQSSLFHELRVMAAALLEACSPLAWGALVLVLVMYIFAVFLLQGAATYIKENDALRTNTLLVNNPVDDIREWYGSLSETMFTLFYAITGGRQWTDLLDPLLPITEAYRFAFVVYIIVAMLGVLKLFTAVFVTSIMHMEERDQTAIIHRQMALEDAFIHGLTNLVTDMDSKGSTKTVLSGWWLQGFLRDERVQAFFTAYELDWRDVAKLFDGMQRNNESVTLTNFIMDCSRLRGSARNFDIVCLQKDVTKMNQDMKDLIELLQEAAAGTAEEEYQSATTSKMAAESDAPSVDGGASALDKIKADKDKGVAPTPPFASPEMTAESALDL